MSGCLRWASLICVFAIVSGCSEDKSELGEKLVPSPKVVDLPKQAPAPDVFRVKLETSKGGIIIEVVRAWAPSGADRFHTLVKIGFYDDCRFFRVIKGFMAQTGMNGDPRVTFDWQHAEFKDDPVVKSNLRGYVTYGKSSFPDSRTTHVFINYGDNSRLDSTGFAPFGRVVEGMDIADSLFNGYGQTPNQTKIGDRGNEYLNEKFPKLDFIKKATIVSADKPNSQPKSKTETSPSKSKTDG